MDFTDLFAGVQVRTGSAGLCSCCRENRDEGDAVAGVLNGAGINRTRRRRLRDPGGRDS